MISFKQSNNFLRLPEHFPIFDCKKILTVWLVFCLYHLQSTFLVEEVLATLSKEEAPKNAPIISRINFRQPKSNFPSCLNHHHFVYKINHLLIISLCRQMCSPRLKPCLYNPFYFIYALFFQTRK